MAVKTKSERIISEEPKFFRVIPASKLEGVTCPHCQEGFDASVNWMEGYRAKVDAGPIEKGKTYHKGCLRSYLLPLANSGC